jgi:hypothetical protein
MDRILEEISEIKVTLAKQETNLAEHMRRTELAETQVAELKKFVTEVRAHIRGVQWLGGAVVAVVGLAKAMGWL